MLRNRIVRNIKSQKSTLGVCRSAVVYAKSGSQLILTQRSAGKFQIQVDQAASLAQRGVCHAAAMAAVYAIGAAAFAAAALVGGITVVGIAISAQAAQAVSSSLAAGSGVSALVAAYIC